MAVYLGISIALNSQNIANNTSNVTVKVNCSWTGGSYNKQGVNGVPQAGGWVNIDGTKYSFNSTFNDNRTTTGSKTLYTRTVDIKHTNDGKKTLVCSSQFDTHVSSGVISASNSLKLTDIPRFATMVSAPNFNDEENPTITYSNPAGNSVSSLQACISLDISKDDIAYRDISKTGTSYTFNLTAAERDILRAATTSNSRTVYFFVRSTIGEAKDTDRLARTLTIKNPNPTINPTIADSNSTTVSLTGDSSVLVKYYSNAAITIGAAAVKKATLKSQKVVCGNKSLTANGTMTAVESNSFVFTATDSRENTTKKTVTPSFVEYVKLSCGLGNNMPDADGSMTVKVTGNYFNGSFGAKSNSLSVYYRYKTVGGSYNSWTAMTVTKSGNTYSATANLTGLDYQTTYAIQAYAVDALATVYSVEKNVKATPVFDWSESDFKFNVPVEVDGDLSASSLMLKKKTIHVGGDLNTYYPVYVYTLNNEATPQYLFLKKYLGTTSPAWSGNHSSGTSSCAAGWMYRAMGWDGNGAYFQTLYRVENYAKLIGHIQPGSNAGYGVVLWLRGGGAEYQLSSNLPFEATVYLSSTNISNSSYPSYVEPITSVNNGGIHFANTPFNLDAVYPVNSIYISYSHTSPASLFGGTWTRIENTFLWGCTANGEIGKTGGEQWTTLTIDQMPSHSHDMPFAGTPNGTQSPYKYIVLSSAASNGDGGKGNRNNMGTFAVGGGAAHNNMPPYAQVSIWRRTA